jgi:putative endonuclease
MWYVYFLLLANADVYVGSSNDLRRRVVSHQDGEVASTKAYRPVKLMSYVAVGDEALARSLERYFKTGSGKAVASKRFWRRDPAIPPQRRSANARAGTTTEDGGG